MHQPLLRITNLSVDFIQSGQTTHALNNINILVNRGEILAIVGESGSGKSVTALSVLQLLASPPARYTSGEIIFTNGTQKMDMLRLNRAALGSIRGNRMGMIFQEPMTSLNPVISCGNQVMEALIRHRKCTGAEARERTLQLFEKVRLPDPPQMFTRYPHQLSGGQKQRVMIAMALSCDPDLLLCDEPTTALDVTVQKSILLLIKEWQLQLGMAVIFITHDLSVVAEIADRVAVVYKGEIVEQKVCEQLFKSPEHPYTKALLACRPLLHRLGERLPVVTDFMEVDEKGNITEKKWEAKTLRSASPSQLQILSDQQSILMSIQNLNVYFPRKKNLLGNVKEFTRAVDGVNFFIREGETLGLVGESGCGKSTLGRAMLGLIPVTGGSITYQDIDLLNADKPTIRHLRREMQIIFQDPYSSLNPRIRIGEAIAEPLQVHGIEPNRQKRYDQVIALLEKVDLKPEHYYRYPHEFSGGQRQRIVIARALALKPSFLICDESVSALDVSVQAQVLNLLNDLKKEMGFTILFISHDLSVVKYISDRIAVMQKGRIVEIGPAEQIFHNPESDYTKSLIAAIPGLA